MKKEIADKWIAALRSGDYVQTLGGLKTEDGFCCLGVLCDIHAKETENEWATKKMDAHFTETFSYKHNSTDLPVEVQEWAGIKTSGGELPKSYIDNEDEEDSVSLIDLNDNRHLNFSQIAEVIEKEVDFL